MIWVDAQLAPAVATWLTQNLSIDARAVRDLGLRDAEDREIFLAARKAGAIVLTKDSDFMMLQTHLGSPPKIIWLTCGNTSNHRVKEILKTTLVEALRLLETGEDVVEIRG